MAIVARTQTIKPRAKSVRFTPLLRLAWRNLWRHKTRTLLLILVVAYATLTVAFLYSFNNGANNAALRAHASYVSAPVQISSQQWFLDPDPENALPDLAFTERLQQLPNVQAVTARLEFPALIRSAYTAEGALVRGVDPQAETKVSKLSQGIGEGRWLQSSGEVVLGYKLAERIDARVGERIVIDAASQAGPQAAGVKVVGLLKLYIPNLDESAVLISLEEARTLTGVPTATTVALAVPWGREETVANEAQKILPNGLRADGVWNLLGAIRADIELENQFMPLFGFLFSFVGAFAVTSAILVSVIERIREFGIISALGLSPRALALMVTLESVFTALLGWLVGLVISYALIWYFATHNVLGNLMREILEAFPAVGLTSEIYTDLHPIYALYATVTVVLAAVFSVLIPARRVLKLKPTDAIRTGQ
jgi:lipoprotein-releasing system permease protein